MFDPLVISALVEKDGVMNTARTTVLKSAKWIFITKSTGSARKEPLFLKECRHDVFMDETTNNN